MLNIRRSEELESRLSEEAEQTGIPRSELVRTAVHEMLERKAAERRARRLEEAARVIAEDPALYNEARDMEQEFLLLENEASDKDDRNDAERWW